MTIQDRLSIFLTDINVTTSQFERKANLGVGAASKLTEKSYRTTFAKISKAFPQLNIHWLKTGEGEMKNAASDAEMSQVSKDGNNAQSFNGNVYQFNDPTELIKSANKLCSLEKEVKFLRELIEQRDIRLAEKDERISELKEQLSNLNKQLHGA